MTAIGFELEIANGAASVLEQAQRLGLTNHEYLHDYHCPCDECEPFGMETLFKAQEDGSCDGEFITRVLDYGSADYHKATEGIGIAVMRAGADVYGEVGNHVHVSHDEVTSNDIYRVMRIMGRYSADVEEIASGRRNLRGYNGRYQLRDEFWTVANRGSDEPGTARQADYYGYCSSSWLSVKRETLEFRVWNSTAAPWRIRTHVGLSVAIMAAARDGVHVLRRDRRAFEDVVGPYMDDDTWSGVLRQRYSKGGMAA